MADLRITDLPTLLEAGVAAGDYLPIADVSASETKKVTAKDLVEAGVTLIDNGSIPASKLAAISPASLGTSSAAAQFIAGPTSTTGSFTARTIAPSDLPLATVTTAGAVIVGTGLSVSSGTLSAAIATSATRGAVSVPSASGLTIDGSGVLSHASSVTAQTKNGFTINATGHITAVGSIAATDLPPATAADLGGVSIGSGLSVTQGGQLNHAATIAAGTTSGITYNATGHITAVTALTGNDLPSATTSTKGAVSVPAGALSVSGAGALTHNDSGVVAGSYAKVTVDGRGHVTAGGSLSASDIPELSANKLTSGTLSTSLLATKSIQGVKLADSATVQFGGSANTQGVVTFPTAEFKGQMFFDAIRGDLYLFDGNAWQPITITAGELIYAGTYNASTNKVQSVTAAGSAAGFVANAALPPATNGNLRYYFVVSDSGTGTAPAPAVTLAPPDMIVSGGTSWELVDVSNAIAGQAASNISFTPSGDISSTNVQAALQEVDTEKLAKAGGTITGELLIGTTGSIAFEGATNNEYETLIAVVDPTADRTITLPDTTGTVITTGDTGTVTSTMLAGSIADSKLNTISTAGKVDGAALTGTLPSAVLGNSTTYVGTTAVALNRSSANQGLTGITSIALPGATSGTVTITPAATAGTTAITLPATSGTLVTTGDTGTVTSTMLANGTIVNEDVNASAAIAGTKIAPDFGAQNVTTTGTSTAASYNPTSSTVPTNGVYLPAANSVGISTNGAGRLFITSAGDACLGSQVGPNNDGSGISIYNTSFPRLSLRNSTTGNTVGDGSQLYLVDSDLYVTNNENASLIFRTNATERLRITSAGLVGIGVSSPLAALHVAGGGIFSTTTTAGNLVQVRNSDFSSLGYFGVEGPTGGVTLTGTLANATVISSGAAGTPLQLGTGGTIRATLTSTGLGIGTTSPSNTLHIAKEANHGITLERTVSNAGTVRLNVNSFGAAEIAADNAVYLQAGTSTSVVFNTNGASERARIDSSGRLLVGTSTARANFYNAAYTNRLQIEGTTFETSGASLTCNNTVSGEAPILALSKSAGSSVGSNTLVSSGHILGLITFQGSDGTEFVQAADIKAEVDGTPGANDMPGRLVFSTTADGASSPTERMRISQTGMCSINTTLTENSAYFDGKLRVLNSGTGTSFGTTGAAAQIVQTQWHQATTGDNGFTVFGTEAAFTVRGSISYNRAGGVVAYNTTSDYRAKTILGDIQNPGETIDALKVYRGVMNGATTERPMLVAHEAQEVAPYCVTGEKDAVDDDGNPIYQQMDHQVLVPLLIAEIQQLRARVAALESA